MAERKAKTKKNLIPTLEELFQARVHLGHQTRRWSPKMSPYIFTAVKKTHLFDLEKTREGLKRATEFLRNIPEGEKVIFVGTKRQAKDLLVKYAKEAGAFYVAERWVGGILTNFDNVHASLTRLAEVEKGLEEGKYANLTKKERLLLARKVRRDKRLFGGLLGMEKRPYALVIVDPRKERVALLEANRSAVPVVALVDSNTAPDGVDYVIPGNDDATTSLEIILKTLAGALKR